MSVDPDEARETADEILDGAEYAEPAESIVDRALEWLGDRFGDVLDVAPGGGPGAGIGWLFVVVLVGLAVWLVVKALRAPRRRRGEDEPAMRYGTESHREASVWMEEAARLAAAGDHAGALRCRHQALVARLVTDGVVDDVAGRTAGEYRDLAVRRLPDQADRLGSLTTTFDDVWYGGAAAHEAGYRDFDDECQRVESAITAFDASTTGDAVAVP